MSSESTAFWEDPSAFSSCWLPLRYPVNDLTEAAGVWPGVGHPNLVGWTSLCTPMSFPPENWEVLHPHAPPPPTDPHLLSRLWALCLFPKVFQDRNKNNGICEADFVYSQVSWLSVITFFFPNVEVFLRMSWGRADINLGRGQRAYGPQCHANNSSCPFLRTWKNGREEETCLATRSSVPLIRASCQLLEKCWLCFTN